MIPKGASLEDLVTLDSIGLFLNPFDITFAYFSALSNREISGVLDHATKRKPLTKFRKMLSSSQLKQQIQKKVPKAFHSEVDRISTLKLYDASDPAESLLLITFFDGLISRSVINPYQELKIDENRSELIASNQRRRHARLETQVGTICYEALNPFYRKAIALFEQYNSLSFSQFETLFENGLAARIKEEDKGASFGLYLLAHTDLRINLLSLYFSERSPETILQWMTKTGRDLTLRFDKGYPKGDEVSQEETKKYIMTIVDKGNRILQLDPSLSAHTLYQPSEYSNVGQLVERLTGIIKGNEKIIQQRGKTYASQTEELREENASLQRRLEEERGQKTGLAEQISQKAQRIAELEAREPTYDPDERYDTLKRLYDELQSGNQGLMAEKLRLSGKVQRLQQDLEAAKSRSAERQGIIDAKNDEIRKLEGDYGSLQQRVESLMLIPTLEKIYGEKSVLFITGFHDQRPKYKRELEKVFGYAEVVAPDEVKRQNHQDFDVVMMAGGLTRHPDRWFMESQGSKVIMYPNQPNQVLQFLYERSVQKKSGNGK